MDTCSLTLECQKCGEPLTIDNVHHASAERGIECWPRPIPCDERLPAIGATVLGYSDITHDWQSWTFVCDDGWSWSNDHGITNSITHWLPLPPKPE